MDLEAKRKRIETVVKLAAVAGVGFFVAPFIFIAIKGIIGLALTGETLVVLCDEFAAITAANALNNGPVRSVEPRGRWTEKEQEETA